MRNNGELGKWLKVDKSCDKNQVIIIPWELYSNKNDPNFMYSNRICSFKLGMFIGISSNLTK